jgi:hypothetical protein
MRIRRAAANTTVMREYRIYSLDDKGHIIRAYPVECPDDVAAQREAMTLCEKSGVEVWEGARLVAMLNGRTSIAIRSAPTTQVKL